MVKKKENYKCRRAALRRHARRPETRDLIFFVGLRFLLFPPTSRRICTDAAATLVHALVTSRLDNGNALLCGITEKQLNKLQLAQNAAERMLTRTRKFDHISSILMIKLHWLPIRHRIHFKLIMPTWKALHDVAPNYLCELLLPYTPKRTLRSTDKLLLTTPRTLSSYGDRAFYAAAPKLWNTLPLELRSCTSIGTFKKSLKTYLFEIAHDITTD